MWGGLLIEYRTARVTVALGLSGVGYGVGRLAAGLKNQRRLILDDRQLHTCTCMHASRSNMSEIDNVCMFAIASEHARLSKRGVITCNIIYCVFCFLQFF